MNSCDSSTGTVQPNSTDSTRTAYSTRVSCVVPQQLPPYGHMASDRKVSSVSTRPYCTRREMRQPTLGKGHGGQRRGKACDF